MNPRPRSVEKVTAELQELKKSRTTVNIEINLSLVFAIIVQSQIIYSQEKERNIKVANAAMESGRALQTMFRIDSEIYKMLQISWKLPESEIRKILEMT